MARTKQTARMSTGQLYPRGKTPAPPGKPLPPMFGGSMVYRGVDKDGAILAEQRVEETPKKETPDEPPAKRQCGPKVSSSDEDDNPVVTRKRPPPSK